MNDFEKQLGTSSILHQVLCIIPNQSVNSNSRNSPKTLISGQNWRFFVLRDLENWWMTLKSNRAPHLHYVKLCASFEIHRWSQTWVTVRKRSIKVNIGGFLSCVTLWRTDGRLDRQTDGRTEISVPRAAWSQLKMIVFRWVLSLLWCNQ